MIDPNIYSAQEGLEQYAVSAARRSSYPITDVKVDVGIILNDEQWNAVLFALESMLIAQCTEGSRIVADHVVEYMHEALHHIHNVVGEVLAEKAMEELEDGSGSN
jgi:hypothetical protein